MSRNTEVITRVGMRAVHPGELLKQILDGDPDEGDARVSVMAAARALGVSRQTLHRVLAGTSPITVDMAQRIGAFLGNGPGLWLRMQTAFDLWHAERSGKIPNVIPISEARKGVDGGKAKKKASLRAGASRQPRRSTSRARA